jgi:hypothetical protein
MANSNCVIVRAAGRQLDELRSEGFKDCQGEEDRLVGRSHGQRCVLLL